MKKLFLLLSLTGCSLFASAATPGNTTTDANKTVELMFGSIRCDRQPISFGYAVGKTIASTINWAGLLTAGCWYFGKTLAVKGLSHNQSIAAIAVGLGLYRGINSYAQYRKKPALVSGFSDNVNSLALGTLGLSFSKIS